jgi:hypothetical protein
MRNVRDFGAVGDGVTDDTEAIQHAVEGGLSHVFFPPGSYRISKSITVNLAESGRFALDGAGGTAKIIMAGPGPAFHITGTHEGTAGPGTFKPEVWQGERLPQC